MSIEINNITKTYSNKSGLAPVLKNISLEVKNGELLALLGPSGSGKTTLLRIISGLEIPDSGSISIHGEDATNHSIQERRVGFVFQHYALFRHMNIFDNVAFGLTVKPRTIRPSKKEISRRVNELLGLVQLDKYADRYPSQLSGGQRQRVALARALAVEPRILLLDEPFGALDARVRRELRQWLRHLHDEIKITSVFVTHDQEEALEVADRVVIMNDGQIEQIGTPHEVYENPANEFVYDFVGNINKITGIVSNGYFTTQNGILKIKYNASNESLVSSAIAFIKPHNVDISIKRTGESDVAGEIISIRIKGAFMHVEIKLPDSDEFIEASIFLSKNQAARELQTLKKGDSVFFSILKAEILLTDQTKKIHKPF